MGYSIHLITKLLEFLEYNTANNVPDPFLTSTYNPDNGQAYSHATQTATILPPPPSSNSNAKSPDEQKLQDWIRGKRSKDDFEVLKEGKYHDKWKIPFGAEIVVQGLQNQTDPKFDPKTLQAGSFTQTLYNLQKAYFGTVVLHVRRDLCLQILRHSGYSSCLH